MTPYLGLIALNVVFRLPPLLNAAGVNSDAAIAGLQAMHFLNGETSRFLWGAGYQGTFEVWVIAALFKVGGPTPLMLMLAPFLGHLVLSCVTLALLTRLLGHRATAFIACLVLVFTPQAINGVVTSSPRQWSVTIALCGAMAMAWPGRHAPLRLALGLLMACVALYLDLFSLLWVPAIGLLALLMCCDPSLDKKAVDRRFVGATAGAVAGVLLVAALRNGAPQEHSDFDFDLAFIARNWPLMRDTSLPWLLGAKVWIPGPDLRPDLWAPPGWVAAVQWLGAASLGLLVPASVWLTLRARLRWEVTGLVLFGLTAAGSAFASFLVSNWPTDVWSTRYLAPAVWSLPFSLAALASVSRPRTLAFLLAPYLLVAALGGWLSYGSYVDGLMPRRDERGSGRNEIALGEFLRQRGYEHGYADYWLAHRLTFLWRERPSIAAFGVNRYQPYADAADRARKKAYIFHPHEPRAQPDEVISDLRRRPGRVELVYVAGFTVILFEAASFP